MNLKSRDIRDSIDKNNANVGTGYIEKNGEQYHIRSPGQATSLADIQSIVLYTRGGLPLRIGDVADVEEGKELRTGAATKNGEEAVLGTAFMLIGENSRVVAKRIDKKIK